VQLHKKQKAFVVIDNFYPDMLQKPKRAKLNYKNFEDTCNV